MAVGGNKRQLPMICRCTLDAKSKSGSDGGVFSVTSSSKYVDYLGESTKGNLNLEIGICFSSQSFYFQLTELILWATFDVLR